MIGADESLSPQAEQTDPPVTSTAADVRNCYRLFLGRQPEDVAAITPKLKFAFPILIRNLVESDEFESEIFAPLLEDGYVALGRYLAEPSSSFRRWMAERFPDAGRLPADAGWRELLTAVCASRPLLASADDSERMLEALQERADEPLSQSRKTGRATRDPVPKLSPSQAFEMPDGELMVDTQDLAPADAVQTIGDLLVGVNHDPQMTCKAFIPPGRCAVSLDVEYLATAEEPATAEFYLDCGNGFSEQHAWRFPLKNGRVHVRADLTTPYPVIAFRFDPAAAPCVFRVLDFRVVRQLDQPS